MKGQGRTFLDFSFNKLVEQTFKDFNIIVSDHSQDNEIENLCKEYSEKLSINYFRNTEKRGSSSANINNAIKHADGKLIKVLFQDDFLFNEHALQNIVNNFNYEKDGWMVTACEHSHDGITFFRPFYPHYNKLIPYGNNTISSPSVLVIKNEQPELFDENLIWLMDCDYYKRCYDRFGLPNILNTISVINRVGLHQVTNTLVSFSLKIKETWYIIKKYNL